MSHTATLTDPSPSTIRIVPVWSPMQQHRIQVTPSLLGSVPRPPPSCTCRIATARRRSRSDPTGEPGRPSSPTMGGCPPLSRISLALGHDAPEGSGPEIEYIAPSHGPAHRHRGRCAALKEDRAPIRPWDVSRRGKSKPPAGCFRSRATGSTSGLLRNGVTFAIAYGDSPGDDRRAPIPRRPKVSWLTFTGLQTPGGRGSRDNEKWRPEYQGLSNNPSSSAWASSPA